MSGDPELAKRKQQAALLDWPLAIRAVPAAHLSRFEEAPPGADCLDGDAEAGGDDGGPSVQREEPELTAVVQVLGDEASD